MLPEVKPSGYDYGVTEKLFSEKKYPFARWQATSKALCSGKMLE